MKKMDVLLGTGLVAGALMTKAFGQEIVEEGKAVVVGLIPDRSKNDQLEAIANQQQSKINELLKEVGQTDARECRNERMACQKDLKRTDNCQLLNGSVDLVSFHYAYKKNYGGYNESAENCVNDIREQLNQCQIVEMDCLEGDNVK